MAKAPRPKPPSPAALLRAGLERLPPTTRKLFAAVRTAMRRRFPTANELAYDYGSHVVVAFGPTERGIDALVAIDGRGDGVRLYFNQGQRLPDPQRMLRGTGALARYVPIDSPRQLAQPELIALLAAAQELAPVPLPTAGRGTRTVRGAARRPTAPKVGAKSSTRRKSS